MRSKIIVPCGVILAFCLWLFLHRKAEENKTVDISQADVPVARVSTNESLPKPWPVPEAQTPADTNVEAPVSSTEVTNARYQRMLALWQTPINFYGEVIDENSNPVVDANISFVWNETPTQDDGQTVTTTSDANGLFSLLNQRGPNLEVSVGKEGYYAPGQTAFSYGLGGSFSPNALNPIIFHLRKKGAPAPLMRLSGRMVGPRQYRLDDKDTPTDISFYTGKRASLLQSQFRVEYDMNTTQAMGQQQFNWHCQISVPGGGLQAITDEFPFKAPEQGYQETININSNTNAWTDRFEQSYYVCLPDGKYGRMKFSLICNSSNPFFGVEVLINPSGSKNLEYDKYLPGNIMVDQSAP
jgi:hypothetical protein